MSQSSTIADAADPTPPQHPPTEEEIRDRAKNLPRWRRPRQLRRQLAWTLVLTALASVLLVGGLNFFAARQLLDEGTQEQIVDIGKARAQSIELGVQRVRGSVAAVSGDLAVVRALEDLSAGYDELADEELSPAQLSELDEFYQSDVIDPVNSLDLASVGLEPFEIDDSLPQSTAGQYLQYHYVVTPIAEGEDPATVVDAGDGSAYSAAHADHHPGLRTSQETFRGGGDVLLVSSSGDVVYTTDKRIDIGTNLVGGPYADTELGRVVTEVLPRVRAGDAVYADIELYLPAGGSPVFFAAAAVQSDTEVIGAIVLEIPIDSLNQITTSGEQWEDVGLKAGESYIVGPDLVLRSESREWIEDPDNYLRKVEDEPYASLIADLGSPVGLQVVDTEPARTAVSGDEFSGRASNYLGTSTFSYAAPLALPGLEWVVVVDVPLSDAREPLVNYAKRLGLVLVIILPSAALIGLWLARRLTRPIPPVLETANSIVDGARDPDIPDLGHDEFGDLARRLGNMARELGTREAELADEYEQRRELLLSVLPPRLVEETGEVAGNGETSDIATVVAVRVAISDELERDEDEQAEVLGRLAKLADDEMAGRMIERVRASADSYLYLTGVGTASDGADEALAFASDLGRRIRDYRTAEDFAIEIHIGVATGPVATGVLDSGSLTFGAWGLPVRQAMALAALSDRDEMLIDESTATLTDDQRVLPASDIVDLDGQPMSLFTLPVD